MTANHAPVMLNEVVAALGPVSNNIIADCTFGGGGYTRAILGAAQCTVYGFDRDPTAIERAASWAGGYGGRLVLINRPFAQLEDGLADHGVDAIDGAVFDLGVSSMQLDEAERGFSFMRDGPLSMRMDGDKPDVADVVNTAERRDLASIFKVYGEEKRAAQIAKAITIERDKAPITTTLRLAEIIERASPSRPQDRIHPATRAFQALRIFVNDELGQLARALIAAEKMLRPAGRLVVVTFHSLEDRIVKRFFAARGDSASSPSRHAPPTAAKAPAFRLLSTKPQTPTEFEIETNPRARSAKLRAGVRTNAPAFGGDFQSLLPPLVLSKSLKSMELT